MYKLYTHIFQLWPMNRLYVSYEGSEATDSYNRVLPMCLQIVSYIFEDTGLKLKVQSSSLETMQEHNTQTSSSIQAFWRRTQRLMFAVPLFKRVFSIK